MNVLSFKLFASVGLPVSWLISAVAIAADLKVFAAAAVR